MSDIFEDAAPAGRVIGPYAIETALGRGGFGFTYRAVHAVTGRKVVLKEFFPSNFASRGPDGMVSYAVDSETVAAALKAYRNVAASLARFDHPNVVQVTDFLEIDGTACMVTAYREGRNLAEWLKTREPEKLDRATLRSILDPILDALAHLHERDFLYRDLSPHDIIVRDDAKPVLLEPSWLTQAIVEDIGPQSLGGLLFHYYKAPEVLTNKGSDSKASADVYSFGAILHHLLAGDPPLDSQTRLSSVWLDEKDSYAPLSSRKDLDRGMASVVDACLALDPKRRPQTIAAVRAIPGWVSALSNSDPMPGDAAPGGVEPESHRRSPFRSWLDRLREHTRS